MSLTQGISSFSSASANKESFSESSWWAEWEAKLVSALVMDGRCAAIQMANSFSRRFFFAQGCPDITIDGMEALVVRRGPDRKPM